MFKFYAYVKDPRKKNYTTYETDVILLERILAYIFGVISMNKKTERFKTEEALANFVLLAQKYKYLIFPLKSQKLLDRNLKKLYNNFVKILVWIVKKIKKS